MKCRLLAGAVFGMVLLFTSNARADEGSKQEASAQGIGVFTKDSTGGGFSQHSTNTGGVLLSYRDHFNRWLGADVSYGRLRNAQRTFAPTIGLPVQADIHEATAAAVVTVPSFGRLRPYVLAGAGSAAFVSRPKTGAPVPRATNTAIRG